MLKVDTNAAIDIRFDRKTESTGFFKWKEVILRKIRFQVKGRGYFCKYERTLNENQYQGLRNEMENSPVLVSDLRPPGPHWWWYRGLFYKTTDTLTSADAKSLIQADELRKAKKIAQANAILAAENTPVTDKNHRANDRHIRPSVKEAVWKRDGGRCVKCGSQKKLEFDHIIPISMGGSNTARNIQLLCESCNRSKGGNLV